MVMADSFNFELVSPERLLVSGSVSEVVREALRLLQEREERRKRFNAMLDEVRAEADREGTYTLEEVLEEVDSIIAHAKPKA